MSDRVSFTSNTTTLGRGRMPLLPDSSRHGVRQGFALRQIPGTWVGNLASGHQYQADPADSTGHAPGVVNLARQTG